MDYITRKSLKIHHIPPQVINAPTFGCPNYFSSVSLEDTVFQLSNLRRHPSWAESDQGPNITWKSPQGRRVRFRKAAGTSPLKAPFCPCPSIPGLEQLPTSAFGPAPEADPPQPLLGGWSEKWVGTQGGDPELPRGCKLSWVSRPTCA